MTIAIPSEGRDVSSSMAGRFARAPYFLILDEKGSLIESVENSSGALAHGAAGNAVKILVEKGIDTIIVPQLGPNAAVALKAAGIKVFETASGEVSAIINNYLSGNLKELSL